MNGFTAEHYGQALKALLPSGPAWPKEAGSNLSALMDAFGEEFARVDEQGRKLTVEVDPRDAVNLMKEWEAALALPDPCIATPETIAERRAAAYQKYAQPGGQTIAHFDSVAVQLGYTVTIEEFRPFMCGIAECGVTSLDGPESVRHVWRVAVPGARVTFARAGAAQCSDFLANIARAEDLECVLRRIKPAHTRLVFAYEGT